ncbi:dehydrogenase/reductase SDR family member 7 [Agrilus planipennis]|uniref:Dehydrogenase/reductase SDR family member 7 n=1 Tax=Agrilus planipennis TaxID=224129 RepID=A0A1W4WY14_AGRPL|nr:dehydrogenase/reductase SDR family member 7 [Agrilus planipennis]
MLFTIIGVGVFAYGIIYTILVCLADCDLQLAFFERFGKKIRNLKGKVVFITGASSGIGEGTALALAKNGVKLVLAARRLAELERVKQKCLEISNGLLTSEDVLILQMDMLDIKSHQKYFDLAVQHFGNVDILFNNAGRSQRATWENIELDIHKQLFELNVFSVVNLTSIAVRYFNSKGSGHVAVTSSLAGVVGVPFSGSYTGSKHAIHGFFNSLRTEKTGKNLTVSIICPGPVFTNFLSESFTETVGKKYGISAKPTDRRLTMERCGELCAITLANQLDESWMALFPLIPFTYTAVYFPLIFKTTLKIVGVNTLFKLRDSSDIQLMTEAKKN